MTAPRCSPSSNNHQNFKRPQRSFGSVELISPPQKFKLSDDAADSWDKDDERNLFPMLSTPDSFQFQEDSYLDKCSLKFLN